MNLRILPFLSGVGRVSTRLGCAAARLWLDPPRPAPPPPKNSTKHSALIWAGESDGAAPGSSGCHGVC